MLWKLFAGKRYTHRTTCRRDFPPPPKKNKHRSTLNENMTSLVASNKEVTKSVKITIPKGCKPGNTVTVNLPTGKSVVITIPRGMRPGNTLTINYKVPPFQPPAAVKAEEEAKEQPPPKTDVPAVDSTPVDDLAKFGGFDAGMAAGLEHRAKTGVHVICGNTEIQGIPLLTGWWQEQSGHTWLVSQVGTCANFVGYSFGDGGKRTASATLGWRGGVVAADVIFDAHPEAEGTPIHVTVPNSREIHLSNGDMFRKVPTVVGAYQENAGLVWHATQDGLNFTLTADNGRKATGVLSHSGDGNWKAATRFDDAADLELQVFPTKLQLSNGDTFEKVPNVGGTWREKGGGLWGAVAGAGTSFDFHGLTFEGMSRVASGSFVKMPNVSGSWKEKSGLQWSCVQNGMFFQMTSDTGRPAVGEMRYADGNWTAEILFDRVATLTCTCTSGELGLSNGDVFTKTAGVDGPQMWGAVVSFTNHGNTTWVTHISMTADAHHLILGNGDNFTRQVHPFEGIFMENSGNLWMSSGLNGGSFRMTGIAFGSERSCEGKVSYAANTTPSAQASFDKGAASLSITAAAGGAIVLENGDQFQKVPCMAGLWREKSGHTWFGTHISPLRFKFEGLDFSNGITNTARTAFGKLERRDDGWYAVTSFDDGAATLDIAIKSEVSIELSNGDVFTKSISDGSVCI